MEGKVRLTIDGQEVSVDEGATILEAARSVGINIPTLCYSDILPHKENCRLCVVEVAGRDEFAASCATRAEEGMVVTTNSEKLHQTRRFMLELLAAEHYGDCVAPCSRTCPAGIDIQGYIGLAAQGQYLEALALIKEKNPIPLVIGRVCPHPCETQCRRILVDDSVNINSIKRFCADFDYAMGRAVVPEVGEPTGKKVALIGGGPASLAAAYYLRIMGHECKIFEMMPKMGGMLRYGIPSYRLPEDVLDWEIQGILDMGVDVELNTKLGEDFTVESLKADGWDAIFLGIGSWKGRMLGLEGEELEGVLSGVAFLQEVTLGTRTTVPDKVAVIGGGNVAMDAARTSVRLGAKEVYIIYRRAREQMPASVDEIEGAEHEGVKLMYLYSPVKMVGNGKLTGIEVMRMELGEPDASGRRRPIPVEGSEEVIPVDAVISAIGQQSDLDFIDCCNLASNLGVTRWNSIVADEGTMLTEVEGVFTGGDVYRGPLTVVQAVADGRTAAFAIDSYLETGETGPLDKDADLDRGDDIEKVDPKYLEGLPLIKRPRIMVHEVHPSERKHNFEPIEPGLSEEEAKAEAERCLACGCIRQFNCELRDLCTDFGVEEWLTPDDLPVHAIDLSSDFVLVDPNKCVKCRRCESSCNYYQGYNAIIYDKRPYVSGRCTSCGMCIDLCPTGALSERAREKKGPWKTTPHLTVCPECSVGCGLTLHTLGDRVHKVGGALDSVPAVPYLCHLGRAAFGRLKDAERIRRPLIQDRGKFREASWEEAIGKIKATLSDYSPDEIGVIGSGRASTEANYLLQRLAREGVKTANLDFPEREIFAKGLKGLAESLGTLGATGSLERVEEAGSMLLLGAAPNQHQPAISSLIQRAARDGGVNLVVVDHRASALAESASVTLNPRRETYYQALLGILKAAKDAGLWDEEEVKEAEGYQGFVQLLDSVDIEAMAERTGVDQSSMEMAARAVFSSKPVAVFFGDAFLEGDEAEINARLAASICRLTGSLEDPRGGLFPLYQRPNFQGALDAGVAPDLGPGHTPLDEQGLGLENMIKKAREGSLKGLLVMESDLLSQVMGRDWVKEGLEKLEFLAVMDSRMGGTIEMAHVVLPTAGFSEMEGSFTSVERRIQKLTEVLAAPGDAKPATAALGMLMEAFGLTDVPKTPSEAFAQLAARVDFYKGSGGPSQVPGPKWARGEVSFTFPEGH